MKTLEAEGSSLMDDLTGLRNALGHLVAERADIKAPKGTGAMVEDSGDVWIVALYGQMGFKIAVKEAIADLLKGISEEEKESR